MPDLLDSYRAAGPGHDEMLQATGAARTAWAALAEHADLGRADRLQERQHDVAALLQDQGVTYGEADQAWPLDPLPVLVEEVEWHALEAALQQRAELLDEILTDLYTGRHLLTSGLLPPEVVVGHPGFLRPADGVRVPGAHQLFHLATDVVRNADGAWTALADRTDVPLGPGYAMAGRRVVSEVLASLYRQSRTRRIGPYYRALHDSLHAVAPPGAGDSPRLAILGPGPEAPDAFDHAYLAALLGLPLVQGTDLVVDDGRVWARTLGRREPVDVLLRGVAATDADPLELRRTSRAGTPGLTHAARAGVVSVVNTLGSAVLENPALLTYLPRLCRTLRGEELTLTSAVTYWCGDRSMCSHVIANLGRLVVRPTTGAEAPVRGWELTLDQRADLAARIAAGPTSWVGQEPVEASTTPTVEGSRLEPRRTSLRTFAVATPEGYTVMSGGLGLSGPDPQAALTAPALSGTAKDVWVLAAEPLSVARSTLPGWDLIPGHTAEAPITPRAAQELFHLGRWTERAEATVRLLLAVADRWDDYHGRPGADPAGPGARALALLLDALHERTADAPLTALVTDPALDGSVAWCLRRLTRSAAAVRDNLTPDVWLATSALERTVRAERTRRATEDEPGLARTLGRLLEGLLALHGIYGESLVRDVGWRLLDAGRRLERAQHLTDTLTATLAVRRDRAVEDLVLESVLTAHESALTYRRRYPAGGVAGALELLVLDGTNPRALAFQLAVLREQLDALPALGRGPASRDQLLDELAELLAELRPDQVDGAAVDAPRVELHQALESVRWRLGELATEIARVHFAQPQATPWSGEEWSGEERSGEERPGEERSA